MVWALKDNEKTQEEKDNKKYKVTGKSKGIGPIQNLRGSYVRNSQVIGIPAQPYLGEVKITSLPILNAMLALFDGRDYSNLTDPLVRKSGWTAVAQTQRAIFDGEATSASIFEFVNPEVLSYVLEIEHEGFKKEVIYDPFVFHYGNTNQKLQEFAHRPLREELNLETDEKKDAVTNPADNTLNQWSGYWMTNVGIMKLTQQGTYISGTITQGGAEYAIKGSISNGVFKGSILIPSESSTLGDTTYFEMNISNDGKSINFINFDANTKLKGLNGTKAIKQ